MMMRFRTSAGAKGVRPATGLIPLKDQAVPKKM
jgi:hypothetical protein